MKIKVFLLNPIFYKDYSKEKYPEICRKPSRPYIIIQVTINDLDFGIPLRSNINHPHAFITDEINNCGLDYSKTVVIKDSKYISNIIPNIRQNEWNIIKVNEDYIKKGLINYINLYKKALQKDHIKRNQLLIKYSTLKYFHDALNI